MCLTRGRNATWTCQVRSSIPFECFGAILLAGNLSPGGREVEKKHHRALLFVNISPVLAIPRKKRKITSRAGASYFLSPRDGGSGHLTTADQGRIDPGVVTALYECYAGELRLFLTGVLRNADLVDEALQNTFAKAVESGHTAREESVKGWLFQVAFHEAVLLRRRGQIHDRSLRQLARGRAAPSGGNSAVGDGLGSPDDRLARSETIEQVRRALAELPADQRQVVEMRIYEDKTFAAIAAELSAPLGTVLTRMRLALKRLSRRLGSEQGGSR
jgi:RNA polymerase sigma factor (sigma-70 family)